MVSGIDNDTQAALHLRCILKKLTKCEFYKGGTDKPCLELLELLVF